MDSIDAELRSLTPFPDDLQKAVVEYLRLASKHGFMVLGLAVKIDPITLTVIGNVKERDMDLVELFRSYADIVESKKNQIIQLDITPDPDAV